VVQLLMRDQEQRRENERLIASLTPREREVLACLASGAGRMETAEQLHLSANTVRTHLQSLMAKLGVHSGLEAVAVSRRHLEQVQRAPRLGGNASDSRPQLFVRQNYAW
jgi:DNA-binding CsgD family transcriptional regulator